MKKQVLLFILLFNGVFINAQEKALVNCSSSPYALLHGVNMGETVWTEGFWAERFKITRNTTVPGIWDIYASPEISHAFRNFEIAAGLREGEHKGPSFHDGDFYKVIESMAATYALTKDTKLDSLMDLAIAVIGKAQRSDGYIYTPAAIRERQTGNSTVFSERINFEAYNLGHLMTAACLHNRATGKKTFLSVAERAAGFLCRYYENSSPELARNAICPSHYMGIVEMYRTTGNPEYLRLAANLIDIRGYTEDGTDDNQDRIPFRLQTKAMGHAVRANYLYAGVADVFAETGDSSLFKVLDLIWHDVTERKIYITGGCGALYDGVSPDGTSYKPSEIQKTHQAYGRDYQLPNITAYNESCANIGNLLWNYRMFLITGEARFADMLELTLYNSILAGISLDGKRYFYTNPLRVDNDFPYIMRWKKEREEYISLSNCCPPNIARTLAESAGYAYSMSEKGLWLTIYGSNRISTVTIEGDSIVVRQKTDYPWDGKITLLFEKAPEKEYSLFLRIPGWSDGASIRINQAGYPLRGIPGTFHEIRRKWMDGDLVELDIPMKVRFIESNPLVEELRNQVAVQRGPLVYCLESPDLPPGIRVSEVAVSTAQKLKPVPVTIAGSRMLALEGKAFCLQGDWKNKLYSEIDSKKTSLIKIRMIPYYAWENRGKPEMSVWFPKTR